MRLVIERSYVETLRAVVSDLGGALLPVAPTFEDVYLARLREEADKPAPAVTTAPRAPSAASEAP